MFRHLLMILFRPHVTVNQLLYERKRGQSFAATLFLVCANLLVAFLWYIYAFRTLHQTLDVPLIGAVISQGMFVTGLVGVLVVIGCVSLVYYVGGRYAFSWMVQIGMQMTAGAKYPQSLAERQEKGRLLRLIHPYTLWISQVPAWLALVLLPFTVNLNGVASLISDLLIGLEPASPDTDNLLLGVSVYSFAMLMCLLGMYLYMILVRTSAIRKIYQVSIVNAFWGTFFVYLLLFLALVILGVLVVLGFVLFGDNQMGPGWI